jgi:hypothetical protein
MARIIFAMIVVGLGAYLTWPSGKILDYSTCQPDAGLSWISEKIYGRYFWERALADAKDSAAAWPRFAEEQREGDRKIQAGVEEARQKERDIAAKYPGMGLSPAEQAASALRDRADAIEIQAGTDRLVALLNMNEQQALHCVDVITKKLASSN